MGDNRKRRPLAEVEAELGRPCTHARTPREQWLKYCRKCSNIVSQRRQLERERAKDFEALKARCYLYELNTKEQK